MQWTWAAILTRFPSAPQPRGREAERLAEHTGQVIWATKGLTGRQRGSYDYLDDADLTGRMP